MTAQLLAASAAAAAATRLALPPGAGAARRRLVGVGRGPTGVRLPGPVLLDLVATVLTAGLPVSTALLVVADAAAGVGDTGAADELRRLAERHDLGVDTRGGTGPGWSAPLEEALLLARAAGVAAAPLLVAAAADSRRREAAASRVAAAQLGVRVVLPTGLCLLPAFVLLSVVPLVLALLGVR